MLFLTRLWILEQTKANKHVNYFDTHTRENVQSTYITCIIVVKLLLMHMQEKMDLLGLKMMFVVKSQSSMNFYKFLWNWVTYTKTFPARNRKYKICLYFDYWNWLLTKSLWKIQNFNLSCHFWRVNYKIVLWSNYCKYKYPLKLKVVSKIVSN